MEKKSGKTNWAAASKRISYRERYLKLNNGKNHVRFITDPYKFLFHKVKFDNDKSPWGRDIKCALENCPLCAEDNPVKEKYVIALIPKGVKEVKLLEFGSLIYDKIVGITQNMEGFDDPTTYDVNIVKNVGVKVSNIYDVFPLGTPKPLSAEELALVEEYNDEELELAIKPNTPDEVKESMQRIASWIEKTNKKDVDQQEEPAQEAASSKEADDDDFSFKKGRVVS